MAENLKPENNHSSDEIDLGQLLQLVKKGFNSIFRFILRIFLYLKRKIFLLIGLVVIGLAIGFALSKVISKRLKIEVIVRPQIDSKNYLYDVVNEIQANVQSKDTLFFKSIGIEEIDFQGLEVAINRVAEESTSEADLQYLELLQSFENTDAIADIVRAELQNKSSFNHRITFYYKNHETGQEFASKVLIYINSSKYFDDLRQTYTSNAAERIEKNKVLLEQVDEIISNYSKKMLEQQGGSATDRIVVDNQETLNITGLFNLKNELIRDIETKKIELIQSAEVVRVINFGKPQQVRKSFLSKKIVMIPLILLGLFFLISILKYLDLKSKELKF
ncbi:hypothetical protein Q2T41_09730 [Maribacter confluentis]|uniref:Polysaccharide chain length determinant N-terminal domain-containing protein n=1 Tax=Maribacter confluentis TaxID=1656093 RepID=A0ABT8RPU3_9FLAO|nr:hypothetical protein [Maribacter confluentis]MDO1512933.1 hypothetical protein [Maribacter confluentis]